MRCASCGHDREPAAFSKSQKKKPANNRRCKPCANTANGDGVDRIVTVAACYTCGATGHLKRNCPQNTDDDAVGWPCTALAPLEPLSNPPSPTAAAMVRLVGLDYDTSDSDGDGGEPTADTALEVAVSMAGRVVTIAAGTTTIKEAAHEDWDGVVEAIVPASPTETKPTPRALTMYAAAKAKAKVEAKNATKDYSPSGVGYGASARKYREDEAYTRVVGHIRNKPTKDITSAATCTQTSASAATCTQTSATTAPAGSSSPASTIQEQVEQQPRARLINKRHDAQRQDTPRQAAKRQRQRANPSLPLPRL